MDNYTYYKDEIIKFGGNVAVTEDGKVNICCNVPCIDCIFNHTHRLHPGPCFKSRSEWMKAEHKEKIKATCLALTSTERFLLSHLNPNYYIARDSDERGAELHVYSRKPECRFLGRWLTPASSSCYKLSSLLSDDPNACIHLDFIEYNNFEAWKISDLLKLPIKDQE